MGSPGGVVKLRCSPQRREQVRSLVLSSVPPMLLAPTEKLSVRVELPAMKICRRGKRLATGVRALTQLALLQVLGEVR